MLRTQEHYVEGFPAVTTITRTVFNDQEVLEVRVSVKVKDRTYQARQLLSKLALTLAANQAHRVLEETRDEVIRTLAAAIQVGEKDQ